MKTRLLVLVIVFALLSVSASSIRSKADPAIWDSAAEFDTGNKSDSRADFFIKNGIDQPTFGFISSPVAVYRPEVSKTFIVYQGDAGFLPYVISYDHAARTWSAPVAAAASNPVAPDGHGAPAIWIDSSGYIYIFYGAHNTAMKLVKSSSPYDISSWVAMANPISGAQGSTYPHLFQYNDYIYMMYRRGNLSWSFIKSNTGGASWVQGGVFLPLVGTDGWYIYHHKLLGSVLYYNFVRLKTTDPPGLERHDSYVCKWNLTDDHHIGMNGVDMGTLVSFAEAQANCRAYDSGLRSTWASAMDIDSSGNPYIVYNSRVADLNWDVNFTRWTGSAWTAQATLTQTDGPSSYSNIQVNSSTSAKAFIVAGGFADISTDDFSGDLEYWSWNGSTWVKLATLLGEARAGYPVNRPYVLDAAAADLQVVFDTWDWRTIKPNLHMYAWGDGGFVRNSISGIDQYSETSTDNTAKAGLGIWDGRSDTFSTSYAADGEKWQNVETGDGDGETDHVFAGGIFNVTWDPGGGTGRKGNSIIARFDLTGNWDIRIKTELTKAPTVGNVRTALCIFANREVCDRVSGPVSNDADGILYEYITDPVFIFRMWDYSGGIGAQIGSDTNVVCDPCFLRLTRTGNTIVSYYSTDGSSWTLDETDARGSTPTVWYPSYGAYSNGMTSGSFSTEADSWLVFAGSLGSIGYGRFGAWSSPLQTYAGDNVIPDSFTVTYSGASSSAFISSVGIRDASGAVLYQDETHRISGSSFTIQIPNTDALILLLRQDWKIHIELDGNRASSPTITSISVSLAFLETTGEITVRQSINAFWLILFVFICATIVIGAWAIHRRFAA